ncbi:MAG TPA: hypothetical protein VJ921_15665 [Vicinamibacteria bacterium]|nr:hypothetical protein [Vicinamibacteria bacterium]
MRTILRLYAHELPLFWTGMLGIALGLICIVGMAFHGVIVEPEGNLYKAASFDIAVGLYLLTLALITKIAAFTPQGLRRFRRVLIGLALYGYAVETIQIFRGFDPRFSKVSSPLDQAIGGIFFLSAIGILVCFLVLMLRFFFRPTAGEGGPLVLALRYGTVASLLGFGVGITISAQGTAHVGATGNLLPLHAAGFHALQAIPLVALLLAWARVPEGDARKTVHLAGVSWLAACLAIAWQTSTGRSVVDPSGPVLVAGALLLVWAFTLSKALLAFRRSGARLDFLAA